VTTTTRAVGADAPPRLDYRARIQSPAGGRPGSAPPGRRGWLARRPAWPVYALLVGFPVWWALGIADFMWIFLAFPMATRMIAWAAHGSRRIRVPPGFGIWLLFLLVAASGFIVLTLTAPGTVHSPVSHRVLSYANRTLCYVGVTVLLLYVGNLTERELPKRRLAWLLGLLAVYTTAGGLAGMLAPHLEISSPFLYVLPKSAQTNLFLQASMHPALSQIQSVIGAANGRPKAPYDYTNTWGDCLTILVPWLLVGWWTARASWRRSFAVATAAISVVPLLYTLDRTAWLGVGVAVAYLALRLAGQGKVGMLAGVGAGLAVVTILVLASPVQGLISGRFANGRSDNLRGGLASLTIRDGLASPIIGYGDTRQSQGSASSIAVGPSPQCPSCGQQAVGSTGQIWLNTICSGFTGAALYAAFFGFGLWRYRRDRTPYAVAGSVVLLLGFVYMFAYDAVPAPFGFTMLAYALMWRNGEDQRRSLASGTTASDSGNAGPDPAPASGRRVAGRLA
jgi:hypothetical protein